MNRLKFNTDGASKRKQDFHDGLFDLIFIPIEERRVQSYKARPLSKSLHGDFFSSACLLLKVRIYTDLCPFKRKCFKSRLQQSKNEPRSLNLTSWWSLVQRVFFRIWAVATIKGRAISSLSINNRGGGLFSFVNATKDWGEQKSVDGGRARRGQVIWRK